jgi:HlyD family secretion protein
MDKQIAKKFWTLKRIATISGSALLLIFIVYLIFFSDKSSKLNVEKERLTISEVKRGPFKEFIPITGTMEPIQTFFLDLTEGGKVVQKYIEEGAFVNAGDPIIRLENVNVSMAVMNTQSSNLSAQSQLNLSQITFEQNRLTKQNQLMNVNVNLLNQKRLYETAKLLYEKGLGSVNDYQAAKEQYEFLQNSKNLMVEVLKSDSLTSIQLIEQNRANAERSKNYLKLVEDQLANLTVRAPIKGQLTKLDAQIGQSVFGGYKLGQIDNTDAYKVRAEVPEHYIARVRAGQMGEYEFNGKTYKLIVKTVFPEVKNGIFNIELQFEGEQPKDLRRGQAVHIKLELSNLAEAVMVENGGFFSTTGGQWIFVVDQSGSFAVRRTIKIGLQNPLYYEILEGLQPGEKVITSSYENYGDTQKLILK